MPPELPRQPREVARRRLVAGVQHDDEAKGLDGRRRQDGRLCGAYLDARGHHARKCCIGGSVDARHNSLRDWGASAWTLCTGTPAGTEQHVPQWDKHNAETGDNAGPVILACGVPAEAQAVDGVDDGAEALGVDVLARAVRVLGGAARGDGAEVSVLSNGADGVRECPQEPRELGYCRQRSLILTDRLIEHADGALIRGRHGCDQSGGVET